MAYFGDETEDKRKGLPALDAPAPASAAPPVSGAPSAAGGAPAPAAPAGGKTGTGFIPLEAYMHANQQGAQGMADTLADSVEKAGQAAQGQLGAVMHKAQASTVPSLEAIDPTGYGKAQTAASDAASQARALQSPGGIGALLTDQYGKSGGYGSGMRGFDTFLAGSAGGDRFQQLGNQYGGLDSYLGAQSAAYKPKESIPSKGGGASNMSPKGISFDTPTTTGDYYNPDDERDRWGNTSGGG